jgi:transcriptional regulator with XRE-family HTH domain
MEILTSQSWRGILQRMIRVKGERQRLAIALGLSPMTLTRWANGDSTPQFSQLIRLVQIVQPHIRNEFIETLEQGYPSLSSSLKEITTESIPSEFFAELLTVRSMTSDSQRFWRISDLVLSQVLRQLDPNNLGMSITLVQCMPPLEEHHFKVYSMRELVGKGTFPSASDLEQQALFLGAESLAGYVTETGRPSSIENLANEKLTPANQSDFEVSAAAHPIMFGGRVAGCLLASSTKIAYFTHERTALLATFSDLVALAFNKSDFYATDMIELKVMPRPEIQRPLLASFQHRVTQAQVTSAQQHHRMTIQEAQQQVWREIEAEFIRITLSS